MAEERDMATAETSKFQEIFERMGRPFFLADCASNLVTYMNSAGEDLCGFRADGIVGQLWERVFDENSIIRIKALFSILEANPKQTGRQELQLMVKRKTGRPVQVNLVLSRIDESQSKSVWIFDLEDLTPILNLQAEKDSLRAEMGRVGKLADIGRLTGGIAHELNNPLAILQGLSENLSDLVSRNELSPGRVLQELLPMQETITRMTRIIQSMMSVARGEEPIMEAMSVGELWERATISFQALDQLRNVKVRSTIDPSLSIVVDSIRIEQIFVNLVKNALHALQTLPAEKREIRVSSVEQRERILVYVENSGPPIPEKVGENIYTPFFTTKPVGEGFGLGLFLAYNVMKAHGGALSHENLKPTGVRFILSFPKRRALSHTSRYRVLICDDEVLFRQTFARRLESLGFQVTMARDAGEVIQAFQEGQQFEIMLCDVRLPGIDGTHLVDDVRKLSQLPIIFVTGYGSDSGVEELIKRDVVQGVIDKPVDDEVLLRMLQKVLKIQLAAARAG